MTGVIMFKKIRERAEAKRTAKRDADNAKWEAKIEREQAERRVEIAAEFATLSPRTPNEAIKLSEKLLSKQVFDLGLLNEAEQVLIDEPGKWATIITAVTLHTGRRVLLNRAGHYSGGINTNGWADTTYEDDGSEGPSVRFVNGRIELTMWYGTGSAHCSTIDRIRATLDEVTGDPMIEVKA